MPEAPNEDRSKTPGDGTLDGAIPAGRSSEDLRRRAKEEGTAEPGTG